MPHHYQTAVKFMLHKSSMLYGVFVDLVEKLEDALVDTISGANLNAPVLSEADHYVYSLDQVSKWVATQRARSPATRQWM